jgi:tRNA A-37 threonylcarbamoyl transferase component Bud32
MKKKRNGCATGNVNRNGHGNGNDNGNGNGNDNGNDNLNNDNGNDNVNGKSKSRVESKSLEEITNLSSDTELFGALQDRGRERFHQPEWIASFHNKRFFAAGDFSKIYKFCNLQKQMVVLKLYKLTDTLTKMNVPNSVRVFQKLSNLGLAPKLYDGYIIETKYKNASYMVYEMEDLSLPCNKLVSLKKYLIQKNLSNRGLYTEILKKVKEMNALHIYHFDLHFNNIMVAPLNPRGLVQKNHWDIRFIDFDDSRFVSHIKTMANPNYDYEAVERNWQRYLNRHNSHKKKRKIG